MFQRIKQLIKSREIVYYLIWREIKTSHRDKFLGNLWMLLDPLLMTMVLYFIFQKLRARGDIFCLYLLLGLLGWSVFQKSVGASTNCLRANKGVIHKFPLPLVIFPAAIVLHKVFDIAWGLIAFLVLVWIYHESFRLKWWKAFIVWVVHALVILVLSFFVVLFGIATLALLW